MRHGRLRCAPVVVKLLCDLDDKSLGGTNPHRHGIGGLPNAMARKPTTRNDSRNCRCRSDTGRLCRSKSEQSRSGEPSPSGLHRSPHARQDQRLAVEVVGLLEILGGVESLEFSVLNHHDSVADLQG